MAGPSLMRAAAAGLLLLATPATVLGQGRPPEEAPRDVVPAATLLKGAPTAVIASGGLRVTVALPDARRGFYRQTRFDWSGMVVAVARGGSRFYGPWFDGVAPNIHDFVDTAAGVVVGPRNAGTGPAEEFASRDGETVPGYNSTPAGGTFIKIGVGRLRKDDDRPYDHFAAYTIVDHGRWTVRRGPDRIVFTQRLEPDAGGYGFEYEKTLRVGPGGMMTIEHRLRNIGGKPIMTQVYNHNLARFDGAEIGPGVSVAFPVAPVGPPSDPRLATIAGNVLRYDRALSPGDRLQLPPLPGASIGSPAAFTVIGANGASITMKTDSPLVRAVLWSIRRSVAVEPFIALDVPPGAEQRWSWTYTYTVAK